MDVHAAHQTATGAPPTARLSAHAGPPRLSHARLRTSKAAASAIRPLDQDNLGVGAPSLLVAEASLRSELDGLAHADFETTTCALLGFGRR